MEENSTNETHEPMHYQEPNLINDYRFAVLLLTEHALPTEHEQISSSHKIS